MTTSTYNFSGKRVLVTGAAQGIGEGIVTKLVQNGATVIAVDYNTELLSQLKNRHINNIETLTLDLSDWDETAVKIKSIHPIDLLVNNAGIAFIGLLTEMTEKQFDQIFAINVKALINVTKLIVEQLIERKVGGSIVNMSSQASKAALHEHTLYCASKGAVDAFTRAAALEYGPYEIRINCVNPTVVMTDLGRKVWSDPRRGGPMLEKIPLNRFAEIDDVADAVLFLLSDNAKMVTGTCLPVDGGFLAC